MTEPQDFWIVPSAEPDGLTTGDNAGGGLTRRLRGYNGTLVRGRFIPDKLTPEQVYAEIARLLNLLEPTVGAPCVQRVAMSKFLDGTLDVELDENGHAIRWTREDVEGIFTQIGDDIDGACEEIHEHVNWAQLARDHRAGEDADARCSDAD